MTEIITLVAAITALIVAITALVKLFQTSAKIQEIHLSINSRMDKYLALVEKSSHAEGVKQEVDRLKS